MANRGVQTHGGTNAIAVQHALQAPETDAEAVVKPAKVGDVRRHRHPLRWGQHRTGHRGVDVPLFDVDHWPYGHAGVAWEFEGLTHKERYVVSTRVGHNCSWLLRVQQFDRSIAHSQDLLL